MARTLRLEIVTPEAKAYSEDVEMVVLPGTDGELGIYPRHTPLITRIKPGSVRIKLPGQTEEELVFVAGGVLEVQPGVVTVLADTAIRGHDLDEAKALEAQQRARDAAQNRGSQMDYAKAIAELAEASAQLAAIRKLRKR